MDVPALQILNEGEFITAETRKSRTEYILNVDLNEFQHIEIDQLIEKKLMEYNTQHNIPDNPFQDNGIAWNKNIDLLKDKTDKNVMENTWLWSTTYSNWKIIKSQNIWASRAPLEKLQEKVKHGDLIVFYVIKTGAFAGIFRVIGRWYTSHKIIWTDEKKKGAKIHRSQIRLKPVKLGFVKAKSLESLEIFKDKDARLINLVFKGNSGYPSNRRLPISTHDLEIIIDKLRAIDMKILDDLGKTLDESQETLAGTATCKGICRRYRAKKSSKGHYVKGNLYCKICSIFISYLGCNDKSGETATQDTKGHYCKCCGYRARTRPHQKRGKEIYQKERGIKKIP